MGATLRIRRLTGWHVPTQAPRRTGPSRAARWKDARGYATIALPQSAGRLHGDLAYELRSLTPGVTAEIAAELLDGRFTIATDEPHVKVAWCVIARRPHADPLQDRSRKEER